MSTETKERPILFSGPMVRAILDGRKTMTRRVVKPQPVLNGRMWELFGAGWSSEVIPVPVLKGFSLGEKCPYGVPGDRLWVRETWRAHEDDEGRDFIRYQADDSLRSLPNTEAASDFVVGKFDKWYPSIHMPRWAARILLEVTDVRVERLQQIKPCDVQKEGVDYRYSGTNPEDAPDWIGAFRELWDSINAKRGFVWTENPWVWVVEFKRIETP